MFYNFTLNLHATLHTPLNINISITQEWFPCHALAYIFKSLFTKYCKLFSIPSFIKRFEERSSISPISSASLQTRGRAPLMLLHKKQELDWKNCNFIERCKKKLFLCLPIIPVQYYKAKPVTCCRELSFMPTSNSFLSLPPHLKLSGSVNTAKKKFLVLQTLLDTQDWRNLIIFLLL